MINQLKITDEQKKQAEAEINEQVKSFDYYTLEYPLEVIVQYYLNGKENPENQLLIPDDNRVMTWDEDQQSNFIEFILLGLPISPIFVVDLSESKDYSRFEVIDGKQRIRTLINFSNNELTLNNLKQLRTLNGSMFINLLPSRQRHFKRTTIKIIQFTRADEETRRDILGRINSGKLCY